MMKRKIRIQNSITYAMVIGFWAVIQALSMGGQVSSLMKGLLVPVCIYAILAVSLNLTVGILGELSLGHAGFMCVGAFAGAFFTRCMEEALPSVEIRFFLALALGAAVAGVFGILIGIPVLRLKGDYLAIVTLAFGEIIKNLINVMYIGRDAKGFHFSIKDTLSLGLEEGGVIIVKGAQGITGTPRAATFTVGIVLLLVTLAVTLNLIHSRAGRAVMSIRDNRIAAESVGINITKYKLMAFSVSAALAGMAGALYAHSLSTLAATSANFGYNKSITILVFVVLGGLGNIRGSVIAAILLTALPELLRGLNDYRMLIYAVVLIAMMLFNSSPKAIELRSVFLEKLKTKKSAAEED